MNITDSSKDTILTHLINAATDEIERLCGRRFKQTTHTNELVSGTGSNKIVVRNFPITTFTILEERTDVDPLTFETIQAGDYYVQKDSGVIELTFDSERILDKHRATYIAGYAAIPTDLEQACIAIVSDEFNARKSRGANSETLGSYSISYAKTETNADPQVREVINRYKRYFV